MTQGNELFVFASMAGDLPLIQKRITQCDNINYVHPKRGTALFQASIGGYNEIVDYLIGQGADPNLVCPQWGCNAIDALVKQENYKPATMLRLIKAGGRPNTLKIDQNPQTISKETQLSWYGLDHSMDIDGACFDYSCKTIVQYVRIELSEVGGLKKLENAGLQYNLTLLNNDKMTVDAEESPGLLSNGTITLGKLDYDAVNLLY